MASVTKTAIETDRDGNRVRIYHEGGLHKTADGRLVTRLFWTHPYDEKSTAVCCTTGRIPDEVKRGVK